MTLRGSLGLTATAVSCGLSLGDRGSVTTRARGGRGSWPPWSPAAGRASISELAIATTRKGRIRGRLGMIGTSPVGGSPSRFRPVRGQHRKYDHRGMRRPMVNDVMSHDPACLVEIVSTSIQIALEVREVAARDLDPDPMPGKERVAGDQ